jgi:hypothetical protein
VILLRFGKCRRFTGPETGSTPATVQEDVVIRKLIYSVLARTDATFQGGKPIFGDRPTPFLEAFHVLMGACVSRARSKK